MASYSVPKSTDFGTDFPRTPAGKIQKKILREKYWEGYERTMKPVIPGCVLKQL